MPSSILPTINKKHMQKHGGRYPAPSDGNTWRKVFVATVTFEIVLNIVLIMFEPTYIFDWDAYMEEVCLIVSPSAFDCNELKT